MEINFIQNQNTYFSDINEGDCFIFEDTVFMKIYRVIKRGVERNDINLNDGDLYSFTDKCAVYKCKAVLNVEK